MILLKGFGHTLVKVRYKDLSNQASSLRDLVRLGKVKDTYIVK